MTFVKRKINKNHHKFIQLFPKASRKSFRLRFSDKEKGFELLIKNWLPGNALCAMRLLDAWRNNYGKADKNLQKYITARLDIKNFWADGNVVEIIGTSDKSAKVQSPGWFKNAQGQGIVVQSSKGELRLKIKCSGTGTLEIALRGSMDCRDKNNNRVPVWIDFKKMSVNDEDVLPAPMLSVRINRLSTGSMLQTER